MTTNVIVKAGMPAITIHEATERYNAIVEFTKTIMKPGKDFGVIPGTGDKPTLLKPGAEKLCSLFGLSPEFEIVDSIRDFETGLFYFHYRCRLSRSGEFVAAGEGSANSKEKKYRYRNVFEWEATDEQKENAVRVDTRKKRNGSGTYKVYVFENTEPFDLINTLQKMAQKRALVAATLIAANASEFFTQDVEDMQYVEAEVIDVSEPTKQEQKPAQKQPAKQSKRETDKPQGPVGWLLDWGVDNTSHAAQIANLLKFNSSMVKSDAERIYNNYRDLRDSGKTVEEAAEAALKSQPELIGA